MGLGKAALSIFSHAIPPMAARKLTIDPTKLKLLDTPTIFSQKIGTSAGNYTKLEKLAASTDKISTSTVKSVATQPHVTPEAPSVPLTLEKEICTSSNNSISTGNLSEDDIKWIQDYKKKSAEEFADYIRNFQEKPYEIKSKSNIVKEYKLAPDSEAKIKECYADVLKWYELDHGKNVSQKASRLAKESEKLIQTLTNLNDPILEKQIISLLNRKSIIKVEDIVNCALQLKGEYISERSKTYVQNLVNLLPTQELKKALSIQAEHDIKSIGLINYMQRYAKDPETLDIAKHLYQNYYLKYSNVERAFAMRDINSKYNAFCFGLDGNDNDTEIIFAIKKCLERWDKASGGTVKIPKIINITELDEEFIKHPNVEGYVDLANRADWINLNRKNQGAKDNLFPHELTHFNWHAPVKIEDLQTNPKYREALQEMANKTTDIDYALSNTDELGAEIMQSNLRKIPQWLKSFCIDVLQMPEWMFRTYPL